VLVPVEALTIENVLPLLRLTAVTVKLFCVAAVTEAWPWPVPQAMPVLPSCAVVLHCW
jgi:hypothetical protein